MLLSERVAQKVKRKEKRARISSEVGRVINNENLVYVKETSRKIKAEQNGSNRKQGAETQLPRIKLLFCFLIPPRKAAVITGSHGFKVFLFLLHRLECEWISACMASYQEVHNMQKDWLR